MKIDNNINKTLNKVLKDSLTMINQYFLHARMLNDWGFDELGGKNYKYSIKAMKESDEMIKRILFLEGLPNLQDLGKLNIGENVSEILSGNLAMETQFRGVLQSGISEAEGEKDYVTRDHLKECLEECEDRLDYFETQISLFNDVGSENYHQSIM
ncbi:MAG: bacterioferritin [Candidatus Thioglobus sp.]|uniref:bacterioferritin n=1 Tax=Candidatus Thioglobus sp. TaxID=2026721 RepID=UPI00260D9D2F|nr:bacterioferritin [Candidatus Thioglobus sp.]MDC9727529.1 bacterioferritin [Candidatus Thioglobus sp.]